MADLQGTALGIARGFNWVELVSLLICGILAIFFLFYFNRLFATVLSYAIRAWTWHKYRAYVDITALQISLLGGRVFFKGVRYHAHNMTVLVHDGQVSWRYWLGAVQEAEIFSDRGVSKQNKRGTAQVAHSDKSHSRAEHSDDSLGKEELGLLPPPKRLPCRVFVRVSGVEAFVYNRSPAYDAVLAAATRRAEASAGDRSSRDEEIPSSPSQSKEENLHRDQSEAAMFDPALNSIPRRTSTFEDQAAECPLPFWLRILPISIECKRAAAAIGNQHTTSVVTAKLDSAVGTVNAGRAGVLDVFKLLFSFDFENVQVSMKPNRDYKQPQLQYAEAIRNEPSEIQTKHNHARAGHWHRAIRNWLGLFDWSRRRKPSLSSMRTVSINSSDELHNGLNTEKLPGQAQWEGLARYLDQQDTNPENEWADIEYAKSSTIADCPKVGFKFHWDIPGQVRDRAIDDDDTKYGNKMFDDMNGSTPPDYGMELAVYGGTVVYGPWADRQRVNLQHVFFPASSVDARPASQLKIGEWRVSTVFKICVVVENDVVLRIPTREPSKDARWRGRATRRHSQHPAGTSKSNKGRKQKHSAWRKDLQGATQTDVRAYGWLDITVKANTTVNYTMDMFCRSVGFRNHLDIDLKGSEMTSSVNHGLLWRAGALTLNADMSNPPSWNTLREWPFNIVCHDLELFILRDHMFLITDIINDWSTGPPPNFFTFVPYIYNLDLTFHNFTLYLNTNDGNIISNPADLEYNDFLTLGGRTLHGALGIPLKYYRPEHGGISFDVTAQDLRMQMFSPIRSTFKDLVPDKDIARLHSLVMSGSYSSHAEARVGLTDILQFDINGKGFELKAYGFVARHLVNLKQNYFGDYLHFKTAEEFQGSGDLLDESSDTLLDAAKTRVSNELDVILCINVEDAGVVLPTNVYRCDEFIRAEIPSASVDLRIGSYYMDMALSLAPMSILTGSSDVDVPGESPSKLSSNTQLWISHLELSGHRAFGLPPAEPAYVCTWDIDIGPIRGECSTTFTRNLVMAGKAFVFTFQDKENALPLPPLSVLYDVSFVRVRTDIIKVWAHAGDGAILVQTQPICVDTNDWMRRETSQRVDIRMPSITIACIDKRTQPRGRGGLDRKTHVQPVTFLQTGASIVVLGRQSDFDVQKTNQQAYLRKHDLRTCRAPFLLITPDDIGIHDDDPEQVDPPARPQPKIPFPLDNNGVPQSRPLSIKSTRSKSIGERLIRQQSQASLSESLCGVRRHSLDQGQHWHGSDQVSVFENAKDASDPPSSARIPSLGAPDGFSKQPGHIRGLPRTTFSSNYLEPYFPLHGTEIDDSHVPSFTSTVDEQNRNSFSRTNTDYGENTSGISDQAKTTSILLEITPGIRGYVDSKVATTVLSLFETLVPNNADEILDAFHMDAMGEVSAVIAKNSEVNTIDIIECHALLSAAHIRVVDISEDNHPSTHCDLKISRLEQMLRTRSQNDFASKEGTLSLRTSIQTFQASVSAIDLETQSKEIASVSFDDVLMWLGAAPSSAAQLSIRNTALDIFGDQVEGMVYTVLRILPLVEEITSRLGTLRENERMGLLKLTHHLTEMGEDFGDPPFLSRMVFILRSYPSHFRNQDSWKIIARLRFMLATLDEQNRQELFEAIRLTPSNFDTDDSIRNLHNWVQWRNWDIPDIGQTVAFRSMAGRGGLNTVPQEKRPVSAVFTSETLQLTVHRGSGQSKVVLRDSLVETDSRPPTAPTGLVLAEDNMRRFTVSQVVSAELSVSLDWGIIEMAQAIIRLEPEFRHQVKFSSGSDRVRSPGEFGFFPRHDFQVVVIVEKARLSGSCKNLHFFSHANGVRMSLIGTTQLNSEYSHCESAIINADAAITELCSAHSCIWQTTLALPSLYVDHREPTTSSNVPPAVTLAFAYKSLEIYVREQIPGILQVIDSLILDEVRSILDLLDMVKRLRSNRDSEDQDSLVTASSTTSIGVHTRLSVAILAGYLHVQISLLHALTYHLEGEAASIRIAPNRESHREQNFRIDFDVGRQSHSFVSADAEVKHRQGIFELPPVNGQVELQTSTQNLNVSTTIAVGRIDVEAIALQNVVAVINRDEVQQVMNAIKTGIDDIAHDVKTIETGESPALSSSSASRPIIYEIRLASLGVRVAASTSQISNQSTTDIEFGIGSVHLTASNRETFSVQNPFIPAIKASFRDIGAKMWAQQGEQSFSRGSILFAIDFKLDTRSNDDGGIIRDARLQSDGIDVDLFPETAATVVDVVNHLQDRIRELDLSKEVEYLRHLRDTRRHKVIRQLKRLTTSEPGLDASFSTTELLAATTTMLQLNNIMIRWHVAQQFLPSPSVTPHDAVVTLVKVEFTTKGANEARLTIINLMLQLVPNGCSASDRYPNSALLPEVDFSVAYWADGQNGNISCKSTGRPLDIQLDSRFLLPTNGVQRSIEQAVDEFRLGTATWQVTPTSTGAPRRTILDIKRLAAVLVEADFEGAQVHLQGSSKAPAAFLPGNLTGRSTQRGRYGQFAPETGMTRVTLTSPGIAFKVQYNAQDAQSVVHGQLKIDASSNLLLPDVVPLILDISDSIKEVVRKSDEQKESTKSKSTEQSTHSQDLSIDPAAIFGKTKVDLGLRICRQEFGLSCQPIARVDAKAVLEDLYFTVNTIDSNDEYGHFYAMSAIVTNLSAQVKHVYSREPTFSYEMESIVLSLMNSKHLNRTRGISAILELAPTKISVSAKQLQDLLIFREIWLPQEIRQGVSADQSPDTATRQDDYIVRKYQLAAAAASFPWNITIAVAQLAVEVDLGQSIGKSSFTISDLWAHQQKSSNWEQDLCIGMESMAVSCVGRMSGFVELSKARVRTSISWPHAKGEMHLTPLIQASISVQRLRTKAAFDYQAFAFGDIEDFDFLMYNVRQPGASGQDQDRLVALLDFGKAFVFCTSTSAAQALGLQQAFDRLIQEKQAAYAQSLKDIEKHLRRESVFAVDRIGVTVLPKPSVDSKHEESPISLHTNVVLSVRTLSFGVFPSTFLDSQLLKLEAYNIQARFAVGLEQDQIVCRLGLDLGQLQAALAATRRTSAVPKAIDISVDEVISCATHAKGGTILRVPRVEADMQTWQRPNENAVEYTFDSLFDGKIDVGWNLSRINYIQGMWNSHARSLALRLGKAMPESAVKITTAAPSATETDEADNQPVEPKKIMAEVSLPQFRYNYQPRRPSIIETPQLRDMGEATPPLEWIGLNRDRLPNVTHQVIIVSLLGVAREVEDAYEQILGSSVR